MIQHRRKRLPTDRETHLGNGGRKHLLQHAFRQRAGLAAISIKDIQPLPHRGSLGIRIFYIRVSVDHLKFGFGQPDRPDQFQIIKDHLPHTLTIKIRGCIQRGAAHFDRQGVQRPVDVVEFFRPGIGADIFGGIVQRHDCRTEGKQKNDQVKQRLQAVFEPLLPGHGSSLIVGRG